MASGFLSGDHFFDNFHILYKMIPTTKKAVIIADPIYNAVLKIIAFLPLLASHGPRKYKAPYIPTSKYNEFHGPLTARKSDISDVDY